MPNIQTLQCQYGDGHEWTREARRGTKPRFCPEHTEAAQKPEKARQGDWPEFEPYYDADPRSPIESLRKLRYVARGLIGNPEGRSPEDLRFLAETGHRILREFQSRG